MDLLPALCLCLLFCSGAAFSLQTGSEVIRKIVKEDQDVLLACALDHTNIKEDVFDWKQDGSTRRQVFFYTKGSHYLNGLGGQDPLFEDRVFHFPEQLAVGNASIVIRNTQVTDSGNYTCDFPFHEPMRRAQYELIVEYILKPRNIPGALQKPFIALEKTNDGMLLLCDVEGAFPKPSVEWLDSSGNVLLAKPKFTQKDVRFDVSLEVTVTKSGKYRCVGTQEKIHSQVFAETYVSVPVSGYSFRWIIAAAVLGAVIVLVGGGVVIAVLLKNECIKCNRDSQSVTNCSQNSQHSSLMNG